MSDQETGGAAAPVTDANASQVSEAANAEITKPGSEAESSTAAPEGDKPAKPAKSGEQIRIDELTRRLRESERRTERLMRYAEERSQQAQQPPTPQPWAAEQPKTLKDFNYDDQAFLRHTAQLAISEATKAAEAKLAREREEATSRSRREAWDERFDKFAEEHPEIHDGWDELHISQAMGAALEGSEIGPEIGLYLAKNRSVAKELSKMHPFDAAREIGRIEERLAIERKKASEKPVSQAPPPAPKIDATTASERISTASPDSDKLSDDEWVRAEEARIRRKARRQAS